MRSTLHGSSCGDSCCLRVQDLSVTIGNEKILQNVKSGVI